jgi:hypothetical protein
MIPIQNFRAHPSCRTDLLQILYLVDGQFWVGTAAELKRVSIHSIELDTLGDPLKEFARVNFRGDGLTINASIWIEVSDAALLVAAIDSFRPPEIHSSLLSNISYRRVAESIAKEWE